MTDYAALAERLDHQALLADCDRDTEEFADDYRTAAQLARERAEAEPNATVIKRGPTWAFTSVQLSHLQDGAYHLFVHPPAAQPAIPSQAERRASDAAALMEEAAEVIRNIPESIADEMEVRFYLSDELLGMSDLLKEAHGLAAPQPAAQPQSEPITRDPIEAQNIRERWNIERQDDGSLLVCFNDHDKSQGCRYERFVRDEPTEAQIEAGAEALSKHWHDSQCMSIATEEAAIVLRAALAAKDK